MKEFEILVNKYLETPFMESVINSKYEKLEGCALKLLAHKMEKHRGNPKKIAEYLVLYAGYMPVCKDYFLYLCMAIPALKEVRERKEVEVSGIPTLVKVRYKNEEGEYVVLKIEP